MDIQTVLPYLAPVLPFVISARDQWYKWHSEGKVKHAYVTEGALLASLIVAWGMVYAAGVQRQAQMEQIRRDTAQREQLSTQLRDQRDDLEARLAAQEDRSRLIAEGCISNPKLRRQAQTIRPKLHRDKGDELKIGDQLTVVKRTPEKLREPLRP